MSRIANPTPGNHQTARGSCGARLPVLYWPSHPGMPSARSKEHVKKLRRAVGALGVLWLMTAALVCPAAHAQGSRVTDFVPPKVFQAAGPTAASLQGAVEAYRAALGDPNNGNEAGKESGRREINWDGGGNNDTTTPPITPFNVFLNSRGAQFTTPGTGLSQGPPSGGPQGGLATLFNNPTYGTIFSTFSPLRLFTPVGSNITDALFFVPGSNGTTPATVSGFGAVFTDVHHPDGNGPDKEGNRRSSTLIEYFGAEGGLLFSGFVPPSPGDAGLSFFGIVFDDARIAWVRITSGDVAPGPDDLRNQDIVVMDDFFYGEPQPLP